MIILASLAAVIQVGLVPTFVFGGEPLSAVNISSRGVDLFTGSPSGSSAFTGAPIDISYGTDGPPLRHELLLELSVIGETFSHNVIPQTHRSPPIFPKLAAKRSLCGSASTIGVDDLEPGPLLDLFRALYCIFP